MMTARVRKGKAKGKSERGLLVLRIKRRGIEELAPDLLVGIHEALDPLEDTPQALQVAWVLDKRSWGQDLTKVRSQVGGILLV